MNMSMNENTNKPLLTSIFSSSSTTIKDSTTSFLSTTTTQRISHLYVTPTTTKAPVFHTNTRPTPVLPPLQPPYIEKENFEMLKPGILAGKVYYIIKKEEVFLKNFS